MQLKYTTRPNAILLLEDGKVFHGKAAGKTGTTTGEICFNTGMTGYQEIFTDPSYFGQVIVMNNAEARRCEFQRERIRRRPAHRRDDVNGRLRMSAQA